jgi:PIN domain nuclease of toxin-antitoxin system
VTVIDASALLAYLRDEAGADVVERALAADAVIGALSLAEVLSKLTDSGEDPDRVLDAITRLPLDVVPFDADIAVESGRLRPLTAKAGLSLGDRASLALGLRLGRRVLTANAAWLRLVPDVDVEVIQEGR